MFQLTTRRCLEQVAIVGGPALAEELAEAIQCEREGLLVTADRQHD